MKVKICGITNINDALVCINNGADMLGFIFYNKSKRFVDFEKAGGIISQLPAAVEKVGVFVDEDSKIINEIAGKIGLETIQLHGNESPEYVEKINYPVIKSFRINENFDWNTIRKYRDCRLLLDSFSENKMGGTGKSFDWNSIPENYRDKIILSGGISIEKLDKIFNEIKPVAIDVSSSLELTPGKKDHKKVIEFLQRFHELNK